MSVETTLLNAKNPVLHFHKYFMQHVIQPIWQLQRQMRIQNAAKERAIILKLEDARRRAQYAYDIRQGLLHAV
jgi:hypothetical protein